MKKEYHSYRELADLVMQHGPQGCMRVHREQAKTRRECQFAYEHEDLVLREMARLAYRYGRKKLKEKRLLL